MKRTVFFFSIILVCMAFFVLPSPALAVTEKVKFGKWNSSTTYEAGDTVQYKGINYESTHSNSDHPPDENLGFLWRIVMPNPVRLFDIILTIESVVLHTSGDLLARTQFTSFGTVPTLVTLGYRIEDAGGQEVFSERDEVIVETEKMVTKEFKSLALGSGKYTLILSTTYGDNVTDEFKQAFEVKGASVAKIISSKIIGIILIIISIGGVIFLFIKHKRKKR